MKLKKVFLTVLIFVPLFSLPQDMMAVHNSGSTKQDKFVSIEHSQHIVERSIKLPSTGVPNKQNIIDKEPPLALDVYLDLHKHWKFVHSNINRSDS